MLELPKPLNLLETLYILVSGKFFMAQLLLFDYLMLRWLIASYIVLVLVLSAKATASVCSGTDLNVKKLNYQTEVSEKLNVQDPLPDFDSKSLRSIKFDSDSENFVG